MSVNNQSSYNEIGNEIFGEYRFSDSSFVNQTANQSYSKLAQEVSGYSTTSSYKETYSLPLSFVRDEAFTAFKVIVDTLADIEKTMSKVYINPNTNYDLLLAHQNLWNQFNKNIKIEDPKLIELYNKSLTPTPAYSDGEVTIQDDNLLVESMNALNEMNALNQQTNDAANTEKQIKNIADELSFAEIIDDDTIFTIQPYPPISKEEPVYKIPGPSYICYDQVVFAEKIDTSVARKFLEEFYEAIAHSTFSYIFQFRKILIYLQSEIINIQKSLNTDFGETYENELQQKIAVHYDSSCKAAIHYSNRIAKIFLSRPGEIPAAELDQITKEQTTKFQAFFAIKLNAVNTEIQDVLASLKRDLHDNAEIFYDRYLKPSLKFSSDISNPLELDYQTTSFGKKIPFLAEELVLASVLLKGNFTSVLADFIDRQNVILGKMDNLFRLIHEKRKYANYISQLSKNGIEKPKILMTITEDKYSKLFQRAAVSSTRNDLGASSHAFLDDLDEDHHPQYLLRDGGNIIGDIQVADGVTIDGVDLNKHAHNGTDGSAKISSLDIDYSQGRSESVEKNIVQIPINIAISKFNVDIVNRLPRCSAVINIEVDDDTIDSHQYEIIYTEVE
jgi:hypothetical protein